MGQVSTEQVVAIIDAVQPDTIVQQAPPPQISPWWWSLLLVVIPVILAPFVATWIQKGKK